MLNQVVSSGTTFILGVYLVRILTPVEFGLYGIGFAVTLLYSGIGNALFLTQMMVHSPDKPSIDRIHYAARMLVMLVLFCFISWLLMACIVLFGEALWDTLRDYSGLCFAVMFASVANLMKEYFIRYAYIVRKESRALITSFSWTTGVVSLLVLSDIFVVEMSAVVALWVFGIANFGAVLVGFLINKLPVQKVRKELILEDFHEAFHGGRWALGGVSVNWMQSQAYIYITAILLGPTGVAFVNAAKLFISPFSFLLPALNQIVLPRLADIRNSNSLKMMKQGILFTLILVVFGVFYFLILFFAMEHITPLLIGDKYTISTIKPLVFMWCLVLFFQLIRGGASNLLLVLKAFKSIMFDNVISAVVALVSIFVLVSKIGIIGAIIGTGIGELIFSILLWKRLYNSRRSYKEKASL